MITFFEILYFPKLYKNKAEKVIQEYSIEPLFDSMKKDKGVILVSGHISNWEYSALFSPILLSKRVNVIVKKQSNSKVNNSINRLRQRTGNSIIEIGAALRQISSLIKNNEIICFLVDQSASPDYSYYVNFFNIKTATFSGPAKIALKYESEIVLGYCLRNSNYKYSFITKRIDYSDITGSIEEKSEKLTERIQKEVELVIREHPEQWLWFHKRFKHIKG